MSGLTTFFANLAKRLSLFLEYVWYEVVYFAVGGHYMVEDIIYKSKNKCDIVNKKGEVAVVTGGARGIGAALVKKLLQCEMTVIIGCRNVDAGLNKVQEIRKEGITNGEVYVYKLDLQSMESVKDFATKVLTNFSSLSLLVNNAGIMFAPYRETVDGFESQLAINYLAPFYLTHLLMPLLNKVDSSRVVNVTSCAHVAAKPIHFDNMNMKKNYIPSAAYSQSKLCQLLFTLELDRQLRETNSNVHILAVHPGIVNTDLFDGTLLKNLFPWVLKYFCKDLEAGATTVLAPSVSPVFHKKGGIYLSNCRVVSPSKQAQDVLLQKELFKHSLKVLNVTAFGE